MRVISDRSSESALSMLLIASASVDQLSLHILDHHVCSHNDLPENIYEKLNNNLSAFHFEDNLSNDDDWGKTACSVCYTDLPRLIEGKVGGQVSVARYILCT